MLSHFALAEQQEASCLAVRDMSIPQRYLGIFCRSVFPSSTATKVQADRISVCAHTWEYAEFDHYCRCTETRDGRHSASSTNLPGAQSI